MASFNISTRREWASVLGVDVSSENIKYCYLQRKRGKFIISVFGRYSIASSETEAYSDQSVQMILHRLFEKQKSLKKAKVVVGIDGMQVIVKNQSMPRLSKKEMKQSIGFELQREIEKDGEGFGSLISDYRVLGADPVKKENDEVLVMGVPDELAEQHVQSFSGQNVIPAKLIPQVVALTNLVQFLPKQIRDKSIGILDVGTKKSVLLFIRNGKLDFSREIIVGGDDFTKSITGTVFHEGKAIQFSLEEANQFKLKYGYPLGFSEGMTFKGAPLTEIGAMMRPVVERLSSEIHRSIGFYSDQSDGSKVESLYLIGGGARLKHLPDVLSKKLSISVEPFPAPKSITVVGNQSQKKVFASNFLQQAGPLALALESTPEGNLLPDSYKKLHQLAGTQRIILGIAAIIVLVFALLSWTTYHDVHTLEAKASRLAKSVDKYKQTGQLFATLSVEKNAIHKKIGSFTSIAGQDPKPIQILRLVSLTLPKPLTLMNLNFGQKMDEADQQNKKSSKQSRNKNKDSEKESKPAWILEMSGMSKVKKPELGVYVAQFMVDLEKSGYFESVSMPYEEYIEDEDLYLFQVNAKLK